MILGGNIYAFALQKLCFCILLTINVLQNNFLIALRKWKNRTIFHAVKPCNVTHIVCLTVFVWILI